MAIEFNCPHCQHQYRLKDELAGKTATCKGCRQKITIPQPVTIPQLDAAAAEAAALAALADEPVKVEQDEAAKLIPVECNYCNHKWTEPITRAGKNALCPNPECRQRVKIPEPKDEGQYDWRQTRTKGPSLAKENQQKLEGVQDAADAKIVSGQALKGAGADGVEYEPIPLKRKAAFALLAVGLVAAVVFGGIYAFRSRTEAKEDRTMQEAQAELEKAAPDLKDDAAVFTALMHMAAGEYAVRHDTTQKAKEGMDQFAKAAGVLRAAPSTPARQAAVGELAVAMLAMGGTEEQAREQLRLRWMPSANLKLRPNERVFTLFEELNKVFDLVQGADPEYRNHVARRLARELAKRGQAGVANDLIPRALFSPAEQSDARALVALELYRADKGSDLPRKVATELAARGADLRKGPAAPSAQTLFLVAKPDKAPTVVSPPAGAVEDASRYAYVGFHALEGREPDALKLALATGKPEAQLRALTLLADWAADPGPALDAAVGVVNANSGPKSSLSPWSVLRLSQIAAEKGKYDQSKALADKLSDDGLKAWAKGDALRARLAAAPKDKGDEGWMEVPDDARKIRAGHALGLLWLARHNTRLSGDRAAGVEAAKKWAPPLSAFWKAGVALGKQDWDQ